MTRSSGASLATTSPARRDALAAARRGRLARQVAIGAMAAFVFAGVLGAFGIRQAHQTATNNGLRVDVSYPAITRGGLPARWLLDIHTDGDTALPDEIDVRTSADYFEIFDHNDLAPEPDASWQDDTVTWTYRPDSGDDQLRIELDVRTQPNARWRYAATTDIVVDEVVIASFDYSTFVMP